MATTLDPNDRAVINYDEPPIKPPPVLTVGPLAWMRANLFKSTFDTILTIVAGVVLTATVFGLLQWAVSAANWFVITNNLRLLTVGTYPVEAQWRLDLGGAAVRVRGGDDGVFLHTHRPRRADCAGGVGGAAVRPARDC